jgi:hypothetical protein
MQEFWEYRWPNTGLVIGGSVAARKKKNPSCCLTGGASQASQPSPQAGTRFIWLLFSAFKRCLAPHGTLECVCRWSSGRQGKPSKLEHGISDIQHDRAFSDTFLIAMLHDRADPRGRRPKNIRPAADRSNGFDPENTLIPGCRYRAKAP